VKIGSTSNDTDLGDETLNSLSKSSAFNTTGLALQGISSALMTDNMASSWKVKTTKVDQ